MELRLVAIAALAVLTAGCANERPISGLGYNPGGLITPANAQETTSTIEQEVEARRAAQRSMAGTILAAIALERVTGLKPDPSRFTDLR
jgi:hypothetical protein